MTDELNELKKILRSLVVSSPVQMTLTNLLRDFRAMMGQPIPITKYGYRDPLQFLKDRCSDCFVFKGYGTNTVLIPIVPECLKHIDEFIHKQKVSSKAKFKGKRSSINESAIRPAKNLIAQTFETKCKIRMGPPGIARETPSPAPQKHTLPPECDTRLPERKASQTPNNFKTINVEPPKPVDNSNLNKYKSISNLSGQNKENKYQDQSLPSQEAYKNFMKNRLPVYESTQDLSNHSKSYNESESGSYTSGSGQRTLSSSSSAKATQLEELKAELLQLIKDSPNGVCTTEIMKLYRERYNRELNFSRFGFSSVSVLACGLPGVFTAQDPAGNTRVSLAPPDAPASSLGVARRHLARARVLRTTSVVNVAEDEDALPWIDFDPDVFPEDCMSFSESIPSASLEDVSAGSMLEVMVGEVYSPSHFWFYRLGQEHNIAMEDMMDDMTRYYTSGEGAKRTLALGAVRVGHYCSSVYEQDWHRSLIVKVVDSENVKVRHVDYGTVDRVPVRRLKPLRREWGALPAQAVRARLAGVCPAARGRRWPHAASAAFLRLVQDRRLVANVAHVDREENIVELFLIDTSTERDIRIDLELIKTGHADTRPATASAPDGDALASYLYPRFDALESGDTPNYADIHAYLRDGIALEYVEDYSRHVPPALPLDHDSVTQPQMSSAKKNSYAPPRPSLLDNRIPLIPRSFVDTAVVAPIVSYDPDTSTEPEIEETAEAQAESDRESAVDVENDSLEDPFENHTEVENEVAPIEISTCEEAPSEDVAKAPSPVPVAATTRAESAPKLLEASPEKTKPACRAAPRMAPVPDMRSLYRPDNRQQAYLGQPLMPAPSMPALPFFVFPSPAPHLPPYPPYPLHPAFPPRPYPPAMDGFPPLRNFQPQMRQQPHFPGPVYGTAPPPFSSGPAYSSSYPPEPNYSSPPVSNPWVAPGSNAPVYTPPIVVSSTPAFKRPIFKSTNPSISSTPVALSKPVASTVTATARSIPPLVVTASVAPTPVPVPAGVDSARVPSSHSPPPPYNGGPRRIVTGHGEVTLTVSECEIFNLLSSVDPNAAHWYMVDAISRAMATRTTDAAGAAGPAVSAAQAESEQRSNTYRLNPEACEFRATSVLRPPPGFNED